MVWFTNIIIDERGVWAGLDGQLVVERMGDLLVEEGEDLKAVILAWYS